MEIPIEISQLYFNNGTKIIGRVVIEFKWLSRQSDVEHKRILER